MPVTDVEKLRPELLNMSVAELERRATEIQMAIRLKAEQEEAKRREKLVAEASTRVERVVDDIKWLHAEGFLSAKVTDAFTRADGQFAPATYIRQPRADDVRAPRQATAAASGDEQPVRRRRRRDPVTGELVPSKAARKAGDG